MTAADARRARARRPADGPPATGYSPARVATVAEERDAVAHAIGRMRPGSVVAILADAPEVLDSM